MAENLTLLATESASQYENLEQQSVETLLRQMNAEDKTVAHSVEKVIPAIEALAEIAKAENASPTPEEKPEDDSASQTPPAKPADKPSFWKRLFGK